MKTQIQNLLIAAVTSIQSAGLLTTNLPDPQPRVWRLNRQRPDGGTTFKTHDNQNVDPWDLMHGILYPGSTLQVDHSLVLISVEQPAALRLIRSTLSGEEWTDSDPYFVEWQDEGVHDPMIEATATIAQLESTIASGNAEVARLTTRNTELASEILRLNTAIDAAQNPDPVQA
jgi:hypothetical protein